MTCIILNRQNRYLRISHQAPSGHIGVMTFPFSDDDTALVTCELNYQGECLHAHEFPAHIFEPHVDLEPYLRIWTLDRIAELSEEVA